MSRLKMPRADFVAVVENSYDSSAPAAGLFGGASGISTRIYAAGPSWRAVRQKRSGGHASCSATVMKYSPLFLLAALTALSVAPHASALVIVVTGTFSGANEVPGSPSLGTGTATVTFNDVAHTLRVEATFSGLTGTTTAAHIHGPAAPGVNAGVITQTPSFVGFPLGVSSGSMDATYDLTLASSYNPAFVTANGGSVAAAEAALGGILLNGTAYFNIHTTFRPGGEIRANLAVPDEGSVAGLFGAALGAVLFLGRKRSRART